MKYVLAFLTLCLSACSSEDRYSEAPTNHIDLISKCEIKDATLCDSKVHTVTTDTTLQNEFKDLYISVNGGEFELGNRVLKKGDTIVLRWYLPKEEMLNKRFELSFPSYKINFSASFIVDIDALYQYLANIDDALHWLENESNSFFNGYIVSDKSSVHHKFSSPLTLLSESNLTFKNLPEATWFVSDKKIYDFYVLSNGSEFYLVNKDFNDSILLASNSFVEELPELYVDSLSQDNVQIRLAYMHTNSYFILSMLRTYKLTGDKKYLNYAENNAKHLLKVVGDDYSYARQFLLELKPFYTGMDNGIVLESLTALALFADDNEKYISAISNMAKTYKHTTEGVWNHWTNSVLGLALIEQTNTEFTPEVKNLIERDFIKLKNFIVEYDGQIPYYMSTKSPKFPGFKPTYHTYDTKLLAKLEYVTPFSLGVKEIFPLLYKELIIHHGTYYGHNSVGYLFAVKAFGFEDQDMLDSYHARIDTSYTDVSSNIAAIRANSVFVELVGMQYVRSYH